MADTWKSDSGKPKNVSPNEWSGSKDARTAEGAGKYPNYNVLVKDRSGNMIMTDSNKGAEHITIQHRSGSAVQFMPDGAVQITAHNGQYGIIFGENRVKITGAQDITVDGAASMKVKGDFNTTVDGNHNMTVAGNMNTVCAGNFNIVAGKQLDIAAKSSSMKIEGSLTLEADQNLALVGTNGATLSSTEGNVGITGQTKVGIKAGGGGLSLEGGGIVSLRCKAGDVCIDGSSDVLISQDASTPDVKAWNIGPTPSAIP